MTSVIRAWRARATTRRGVQRVSFIVEGWARRAGFRKLNTAFKVILAHAECVRGREKVASTHCTFKAARKTLAAWKKFVVFTGRKRQQAFTAGWMGWQRALRRCFRGWAVASALRARRSLRGETVALRARRSHLACALRVWHAASASARHGRTLASACLAHSRIRILRRVVIAWSVSIKVWSQHRRVARTIVCVQRIRLGRRAWQQWARARRVSCVENVLCRRRYFRLWRTGVLYYRITATNLNLANHHWRQRRATYAVRALLQFARSQRNQSFKNATAQLFRRRLVKRHVIEAWCAVVIGSKMSHRMNVARGTFVRWCNVSALCLTWSQGAKRLQLLRESMGRFIAKRCIEHMHGGICKWSQVAQNRIRCRNISTNLTQIQQRRRLFYVTQRWRTTTRVRAAASRIKAGAARLTICCALRSWRGALFLRHARRREAFSAWRSWLKGIALMRGGANRLYAFSLLRRCWEEWRMCGLRARRERITARSCIVHWIFHVRTLLLWRRATSNRRRDSMRFAFCGWLRSCHVRTRARKVSLVSRRHLLRRTLVSMSMIVKLQARAQKCTVALKQSAVFRSIRQVWSRWRLSFLCRRARISHPGIEKTLILPAAGVFREKVPLMFLAQIFLMYRVTFLTQED